MANTLLTPTVILREAGRLFHQQARFIKSINREYNDQFAQSGAKVGATIALRDRNAFTVTTGATLNVQDVTETSQNLTISTQKHVGMNFVSSDLTLKIDDFSERYIKPAMAVLVASVESDALIGMRKKVANFVDSDATAFAYLDVAKAKQKLDEHLTPDDGRRSLLLCPTHATKYLDASKGFYNPSGKLGSQYDSGIVKDFTGFDIGATTHLTAHQTGTAVATSLWKTDIAAAEANGSTSAGLHIDTTTTTFLAGDVITVEGINEVHPETKADLGYLKQFVVLEDFTGGAEGDLKIWPYIISSGAKQNCSAAAVDGKNIVKLGCSTVASATYVESLAYHKDAFTFASVDLEDMSRYGGWGARETFDGVSMRLWRQGDIINDSAPCRIDVLYGYLARYPQMACRIHADG